MAVPEVGSFVTYVLWYANRCLIRGEDKRWPLRYDLHEAGGSLPALCEGPDAVDTSYIGNGSKSIRH